MKLKYIWQNSLLWLLLLWCLLSLIYHCSLPVILSGVAVWVLLIYTLAPGVFWNYLSYFSFDQQKKERLLLKALSYKPLILQPYTTLAMMYVRQKRWLESVTILERVIETANPRFGADVKILLAIAYRESGSYDEAVETLTGLLKQGVKSFLIYFNLAAAYLKSGRLEEALAAAEKARSFDVKSTQPVLLMGRIHFELREFEKAKDDYQWAINHLSWPVESYYWLGRAELELGEKEAAIEHFQKAVEKIRDDPEMSDVSLSEAEEWLRKTNDL